MPRVPRPRGAARRRELLAGANRNISTATGVAASSAAAARAVRGPDQRRTVAWSSPTEATPMSGCGARSDHDENPNSRPESAMTHSAAGACRR